MLLLIMINHISYIYKIRLVVCFHDTPTERINKTKSNITLLYNAIWFAKQHTQQLTGWCILLNVSAFSKFASIFFFYNNKIYINSLVSLLALENKCLHLCLLF